MNFTTIPASWMTTVSTTSNLADKFNFNPLDHIDAICYTSTIDINVPVMCLLLVTLIGVAGNVGLLLVVIRNTYLHSAPNIIIVNIAVADLIYISCTAPFYIKHELERPCWLYGSVACKLRHLVPTVAQATCIFSIVALSRERYGAIVRGIESRISRSLTGTLRTVCLAWLAGIIISLPVIFITDSVMFDILCVYPYMGDYTTLPRIYVVFVCLILYILPLVCIAGNHAKIAQQLYLSNNGTLSPHRTDGSSNHHRARKRLAYIVLVITIFFAVFWCPHHAYNLWFTFMEDEARQIENNKGVMKLLRHLNYYMALANSCLNPWIVFAMSSVHRKTLVRICRCCRCRRTRLNNTARKRSSSRMIRSVNADSANNILTSSKI